MCSKWRCLPPTPKEKPNPIDFQFLARIPSCIHPGVLYKEGVRRRGVSPTLLGPEVGSGPPQANLGVRTNPRGYPGPSPKKGLAENFGHFWQFFSPKVPKLSAV
eukprot:EG_transcript_51096